MRKSYVNADVRTNDCLEVARRLYRGVTDIAKKLDEQKNRALLITDIFIPSGEVLRTKLRDYCERLIFNDPIGHAQKMEELLWRRGFYDVISASKKLRKGNTWNDIEKAMLSAHFSVGMGFYHHLILQIQLEYNLELTGIIDFAYPQNYYGITNKTKTTPVKQQTEETKKCLIRFIHRSLICLGDLARYKLDLDSYWDPQIATRYYKMAVALDPQIGMPHNQLGTVAGNKNFGLDAVYHYMRSTLCEEPFEGAEGNLKRIIIIYSLSGKEKSLPNYCVARLLYLLQLWDGNTSNVNDVNQESQALLHDMEKSLSVQHSDNFVKIVGRDDTIENFLENVGNNESNHLSHDMIFKIVMICLMSLSKLQSRESSEMHSVTAFTLAIFSQLVQCVILKLQESLLDVTSVNDNLVQQYLHPTEKNLCRSVDKTSFKDERNDNRNPKSVLVKEINILNSNIKDTIDDRISINGNHVNGVNKRGRDKSKNLLKKLRRPRKRRNSSDSDASDIFDSSGGEVNFNISDSEEDTVSEENCVTDEEVVFSDELTDDEILDIGNQKTKPNNTLNDQVNSNDKKDEVENFESQNDVGLVQNESKNENKVSPLSENIDSGDIDEDRNRSENSTVVQIKRKNLDPIKVLDILSQEKILIPIRLCCEWLKNNPEILKACAKGSKSLLSRVIVLINIINIDYTGILTKLSKDLEILTNVDKAIEIAQIVPLPEDVDLRGIKIFESLHKNLDWQILKRKKMISHEETLLRTLKLVLFGQYMCSVEDLGVKFDETKKSYMLIDSSNEAPKKTEERNDEARDEDQKLKKELQSSMGKLWLRAKVHALESSLHSTLMSPYLVPDHEALSKNMPALKRLVYAKKFIVVIPSIVVSALDEIKRTSSHAREATRWLEAQLRQGSRFLRAQRPHERLPVPLIKGPKRKDKEAWLYFQIIECCHYLTQQTKSSDAESPVVTLLTGCSDEEKKLFTFNLEGLTQSAGVSLEHIEDFHMKWKSSSKSHG